MQFTYSAYQELCELLKENEYKTVCYNNWNQYKKVVILRHDIDMDIEKAVKLSEIEKKLSVTSTYFVMLTSDFYNPCTKSNVEALNQILNNGHHIGLHFDEEAYPKAKGNPEKVSDCILREKIILERILDNKISSFSYHRPSQKILEENLCLPDLVNSYSDVFFHNFKYVSDSRRSWREPIKEIIQSQYYSKIHILTHAFWYNTSEIDIHETVEKFVNAGNLSRYFNLRDNITDIDSIILRSEVR